MLGITKQQQTKKPKQKKCKQCGEYFLPDRPMQSCCGIPCSIEYAKAQKIKRDGTDKRKELKAFSDKDVPTLKRLAQTVFNKYIRERDKGKLCVSCGCVVKEGMAHASHYKPVGGHSYLRFDESNVHVSCSRCNVFRAGNLSEYRVRILDRISIEDLERLEQPNQIKTWTAEELKQIIETYKQKTKELL